MAWKYVGKGGSFLPGVPARDLSDRELKELGREADVEACDLYKRESGRPKKAAEGDKE
jgi:hypothetical protein